VGEDVQSKAVSCAVRSSIKTVVQVFSLLIVCPFAALTGFGRFARPFQFFAQSFALIPGLPGDYLRVAYYVFTLNRCSLHSRVSLGSFFAQSSAAMGTGVYIGAYCVLGRCRLGDRTQIASHVQILSGGHQHVRAVDGRIMGANEKLFSPVVIGEDCWIGASAVVMADIGPRSTIGAGAVVTRPIPADVVAVGNPARTLECDTQRGSFEANAVNMNS
jgi:virginiamycin A acetyltransferase